MRAVSLTMSASDVACVIGVSATSHSSKASNSRSVAGDCIVPSGPSTRNSRASEPPNAASMRRVSARKVLFSGIHDIGSIRTSMRAASQAKTSNTATPHDTINSGLWRPTRSSHASTASLITYCGAFSVAGRRVRSSNAGKMP